MLEIAPPPQEERKKGRNFHLRQMTVPHWAHALVILAALACMAIAAYRHPIITSSLAVAGLLLFCALRFMQRRYYTATDDARRDKIDNSGRTIVHGKVVKESGAWRRSLTAHWNASRVYTPLFQRTMIAAFALTVIWMI